MGYSALPDEIIEDIIFRLPPKSVGRCRCVCKLWRAIIRCHCNRIRYLGDESLIFTSYRFESKAFFYSASLKSAHQVFDKISISATKLSFAHYGSWNRVFGSCHGLLLVGDYIHEKFVLNPVTGEVGEVPRWPSTFDGWEWPDYCTVYAFGYDSIGDDYKLVIVDFDGHRYLYAETFTNIFSLKTGTWKSVESPFYWHANTTTSPGVFVDGSIHWIACNASDYKPTIVAFDLAKETFCEVPPPSLAGDMLVCSRLAAVSGYLCLYHTHDIYDYEVDRPAVKENIDLWVMKDYGIRESWIRFTVNSLGASWDFSPLCMLGQDQVVMLKDEEELIMCDLKEGTFKDIVVHGIPKKRILPTNFVESLVSPVWHL